MSINGDVPLEVKSEVSVLNSNGSVTCRDYYPTIHLIGSKKRYIRKKNYVCKMI